MATQQAINELQEGKKYGSAYPGCLAVADLARLPKKLPGKIWQHLESGHEEKSVQSKLSKMPLAESLRILELNP